MFDSELATFLESGCALIVATVSGEGEPYATRGWGLTVLDHRGSARLLVAAGDTRLTTDLADGGRIAVTAADVRTLRSVQLKGVATPVDAATDEDRARTARYTHDFYCDIEETDGVPPEVIARFTPLDVAACTVTVDEVFDQTPGPGAGVRLGAPQ